MPDLEWTMADSIAKAKQQNKDKSKHLLRLKSLQEILYLRMGIMIEHKGISQISMKFISLLSCIPYLL